MQKTPKRIISIGILALLMAIPAISALCGVIYVKSTGLDVYSGTSWVYAKKTVQAAINAANPGSEIWVAKGTYTGCINLKTGVSIYGGFGGGEILRAQRIPAKYISILDGNSAGSVVTAPSGAAADTVIDGFTIQNGSAAYGGGIMAEKCSITISNNIIKNNKASYYGGGIFGEGATLTVLGNTITTNKAAFGAGVACYDSAAPVITRNYITSNIADYDGSGVYCYSNSAPVISNNLINLNIAASEGAGIYCDDASPVIVNNTIYSNSANTNGGGLACKDASPIVANNIFIFGNSGIRNAGTGGPSLVSNCVFSNVDYDYSGISAGSTDISDDPQFVDGANGDYHLAISSPLINMGWTDAPGIGLVDLAGDPRISGGAVDIGAFETTYTQPVFNSISSIISAPDNSYVNLSSMAVSASFTGSFYIEADNRLIGIRVEKANHTVPQDSRATLTGVVRTDAAGERYIAAATVSSKPDAFANGTGNLVKPFYKVGTGRGIGTVGLLIRTAGKFTWISDNSFSVDKGNGIPLKCVVTPGVTIDPTWQNVTVTGVSSLEKVDGQIKPILRVRHQSDIRIN